MSKQSQEAFYLENGDVIQFNIEFTTCLSLSTFGSRMQAACIFIQHQSFILQNKQ